MLSKRTLALCAAFLSGCTLLLGLDPALLEEDRPETCADGLDNDENGLSDCQEAGCATFCSEDCFNGIDDNADGAADCQDAFCATKPECACGNGVTDPQFDESCDDGNLIPGDGCDGKCQQEAPFFFQETDAVFSKNDDGTPEINGGNLGNDLDFSSFGGPLKQFAFIQAALDPEGDEDLFQVDELDLLNQGNPIEALIVATDPAGCGNADLILNAYDAGGTLLDSNDDADPARPGCSALKVLFQNGTIVKFQVLAKGDATKIPSYQLRVIRP
jgi:cysteine-rich repeat protein